MKVGDKVKYNPVMLAPGHKPTEGTVIRFIPEGDLFRMDMAVIDTVPEWIPAHECTVIE